MIGRIPEGASPDYHCFVWGERVVTVPIWFYVTYNGVTGYYASFYDDSSYRSNEELTAKYGVPACPAASAAPDPSETAQPPPESAPVKADVAAVYFGGLREGGRFTLRDSAVKALPKRTYETGCKDSRPAYDAARRAAGGRPIETLAGWSLGRSGVMYFLRRSTIEERRALQYILLIDPGTYDEMGCERKIEAGKELVRWLTDNQSARLVVLSSTEVSQQQRSKGIQETYFNAIRAASKAPRLNLRHRVLTCNYSIDHDNIFFGGQYWIRHRIGETTSSCPWLTEGSKTWKPTAGWNP